MNCFSLGTSLTSPISPRPFYMACLEEVGWRCFYKIIFTLFSKHYNCKIIPFPLLVWYLQFINPPWLQQASSNYLIFLPDDFGNMGAQRVPWKELFLVFCPYANFLIVWLSHAGLVSSLTQIILLVTFEIGRCLLAGGYTKTGQS